MTKLEIQVVFQMLAKALYCEFEDRNTENEFIRQRCHRSLWAVRTFGVIRTVGSWLAALLEARDGSWGYATVSVIIAVSNIAYCTTFYFVIVRLTRTLD